MTPRAQPATSALAALLLLGAPPLQAGGRFRLTPSLSVGQAYDDNVLSTPTDPQADWVTRIDPGLEGEYRAEALTIGGRYTFGSERFRDHTALSRVFSRQEAGFDIRGDASPRLNLAARGAYNQTYTPAELALVSGLDLGRVRAERLDTATTLTWKASPQSQAALEYAFARDRVATGLGGDTHAARVAFDRKATGRDTLRTSYTLRRFDSSDGPGLTSHVVGVGWTHQLGPRARLGVLLGPRLAAGRPTGLEADASLRVVLPGGELALAGAQTEARVLGVAQPAVTRTATGTVGFDVSRLFRLGLALGVHHTRLDEGNVLVQQVGLVVGWRITPWLALEAAPHFTRQKGGAGVTIFPDIDRGVVLLRLVTSRPEPRVRPAPPRPEEPLPPETEPEGSDPR
jgi:hypothetical protein